MLEELNNPGSDRKAAAPKENWRPQLELDADGGYFVSSPRREGEPADAATLLAEFDLSPEDWLVTNVRRSKWQTYHGEWLESYRVTLKPAGYRTQLLDADKMAAEIKKWKFKPTPSKGNLTALYCIGDTQYGKDGGDGTDGTIQRVMNALNESINRHKEIKNRGISQVALPQLGDCVEGYVSQNGKITGRIDYDLTEQIRIARRVLMAWIKAFAPLTDSLIIPVVPGNHDETTRHTITKPNDSWQIDIVAAVMDACAENPALAHVQARYPEADNSTLAVNFSGTLVGFAHGHQIRDSERWWAGQALGNTPVGQADVLITAHKHHYAVRQLGHRLWIQTPALDGGSAWFRDRAGLESDAGLVSLVVGNGYDPRRDLVVLAGERRA